MAHDRLPVKTRSLTAAQFDHLLDIPPEAACNHLTDMFWTISKHAIRRNRYRLQFN
jgi:hypothetical protein